MVSIGEKEDPRFIRDACTGQTAVTIVTATSPNHIPVAAFVLPIFKPTVLQD